jgi:hypothetical protein
MASLHIVRLRIRIHKEKIIKLGTFVFSRCRLILIFWSASDLISVLLLAIASLFIKAGENVIGIAVTIST